MLGLRHVSILVEIDAQVGGAAERLGHLILMRFNGADLVEDVTVFFSDPDVADRLYGQLLRVASSDRPASS